MKNIKHYVIIGVEIILLGVIGVNASTSVPSHGVSYTNTSSKESVSTVESALNELYKGFKVGNATSAQILIGQTALVQGKTVTGSMTNRGAWTNTPTGSGKVTIPAGYHNGSGYVDTSAVWNAAVIAADSRVSTGTASYIAGYNAAKANITPILSSKTGASWNNTATIQTVVPAGYYYLVEASCLRIDFGTDSYKLTATPSHEFGKVYYASIDTTVTYSVYTEATRASFSLAVSYWK